MENEVIVKALTNDQIIALVFVLVLVVAIAIANNITIATTTDGNDGFRFEAVLAGTVLPFVVLRVMDGWYVAICDSCNKDCGSGGDRKSTMGTRLMWDNN